MKITKFTDFNNEINPKFKTILLNSFKKYINEYGKFPLELKNKIKFNQIPKDIYDKLYECHQKEQSLPKDTYVDFCHQKLNHIGYGLNEYFLGAITFIEAIGIDKLDDRYNTINLYNQMLEEIRNLPDPDIDYNNFRKILGDRYSPSRNLILILSSRFLTEWNNFKNSFE